MNFIRYVGSNACNSPHYRDCLNSEDYFVVDRLSARANASVDFDIDGRPLGLRTSGTVQDFLDLAILVYLADEMVSRSESQDYWTRSMNCVVPVVAPDVWARCQAALERSMSLLSGDDWTFEWIPRVASVPFRNHRRRLPYGFDAVCLFSGGADSLLGAIRLLEEGKRLILVGHQAEGQSARAQTDLAADLRRLYPGRFHFVQSRISRSRRTATEFPLADKQEISHRPRSFLFLALAVAVARECGISDIFMPENGFMTLNIPIQKSRTGSLSTRTTHPAFVLQFLDLCRSLGLNVSVRNPFLTQSKTDMLRGLSPALASVMKRSVSCSRPGRYNDRHVRHCGYCVPCILRRIALMEAGLDSSSDYAFDVFGNLGTMDSAKQQDMRALARFAMELANADPARLEFRVLSHGYFPPDVGLMIGRDPTSDYAPWTNMLRGWATDFLAKLADTPTRTRQVVGLPGGGAA